MAKPTWSMTGFGLNLIDPPRPMQEPLTIEMETDDGGPPPDTMTEEAAFNANMLTAANRIHLETIAQCAEENSDLVSDNLDAFNYLANLNWDPWNAFTFISRLNDADLDADAIYSAVQTADQNDEFAWAENMNVSEVDAPDGWQQVVLDFINQGWDRDYLTIFSNIFSAADGSIYDAQDMRVIFERASLKDWIYAWAPDLQSIFPIPELGSLSMGGDEEMGDEEMGDEEVGDEEVGEDDDEDDQEDPPSDDGSEAFVTPSLYPSPSSGFPTSSGETVDDGDSDVSVEYTDAQRAHTERYYASLGSLDEREPRLEDEEEPLSDDATGQEYDPSGGAGDPIDPDQSYVDGSVDGSDNEHGDAPSVNDAADDSQTEIHARLVARERDNNDAFVASFQPVFSILADNRWTPYNAWRLVNYLLNRPGPSATVPELMNLASQINQADLYTEYTFEEENALVNDFSDDRELAASLRLFFTAGFDSDYLRAYVRELQNDGRDGQDIVDELDGFSPREWVWQWAPRLFGIWDDAGQTANSPPPVSSPRTPPSQPSSRQTTPGSRTDPGLSPFRSPSRSPSARSSPRSPPTFSAAASARRPSSSAPGEMLYSPSYPPERHLNFQNWNSPSIRGMQSATRSSPASTPRSPFRPSQRPTTPEWESLSTRTTPPHTPVTTPTRPLPSSPALSRLSRDRNLSQTSSGPADSPRTPTGFGDQLAKWFVRRTSSLLGTSSPEPAVSEFRAVTPPVYNSPTPAPAPHGPTAGELARRYDVLNAPRTSPSRSTTPTSRSTTPTPAPARAAKPPGSWPRSSIRRPERIPLVDPLRYANRLTEPRRLPNTPTVSHLPPSPRRKGPKPRCCGECGRSYRKTMAGRVTKKLSGPKEARPPRTPKAPRKPRACPPKRPAPAPPAPKSPAPKSPAPKKAATKKSTKKTAGKKKVAAPVRKSGRVTKKPEFLGA